MSIARTYAVGRVAGGNHLTADCDEPEPYARPSEQELLAGDLQRDANKAQRRLERDVRAGVEEQVQRLRLVGGL